MTRRGNVALVPNLLVLGSVLSAAAATAPTDPGRVENLDVTVAVDDGVRLGATVSPGVELRYRLVAANVGTSAYSLLWLRVAVPPCLDAAAFDPLRHPEQVAVEPGPALVEWDAAARTLVVRVLEPFDPGDEQRVDVAGLRAGPPATGCCVAVQGFTADRPVDVFDVETGAGVTCLDIAPAPPCTAPPAEVGELRLHGRVRGVDLAWREASDEVTDRYNVWKVVDGDKAAIAGAGAGTAASDPDVRGACQGRPRVDPTCSDRAEDTAADAPGLVFYRVRAACGDGSEG